MRQKSKKAAESEAKVQDALKGIQDRRFKNATEAACGTGATRSVVYSRFAGNTSRSKALAHQQHLTLIEECCLVKWITALT
jgi:hypothetical protein